MWWILELLIDLSCVCYDIFIPISDEIQNNDAWIKQNIKKSTNIKRASFYQQDNANYSVYSSKVTFYAESGSMMFCLVDVF